MVLISEEICRFGPSRLVLVYDSVTERITSIIAENPQVNGSLYTRIAHQSGLNLTTLLAGPGETRAVVVPAALSAAIGGRVAVDSGGSRWWPSVEIGFAFRGPA